MTFLSQRTLYKLIFDKFIASTADLQLLHDCEKGKGLVDVSIVRAASPH